MTKEDSKFMSLIKNGLSNFFQTVLSNILSPIHESTEKIMHTVDNKIKVIEKRLFSKLYSLLIIGFGATFLILALFSFLTASLGWSKTAAYFAIGIVFFVLGLLIKLGSFNREP
ncbi:MAG: hypothetical protein Q7R96_03720 [Nanoarchaeota archaeon]|nr:hypothetical protein [Nanoarchaeota archaeon]